MKFLLAVASALLPTVVSSVSSFPFFGGDQKPLVNDDLSVPGQNPLNFCKDPKNYILNIEYVDLDPNPPQKGQTLTIKAKGNFTEEVEKDAYINLSVKYGLITLVNTQADLCDQMAAVDEQCPLLGVKEFTKEVSLPKEIPPVRKTLLAETSSRMSDQIWPMQGKYTVLADVYTNNDNEVTCLNALAQF
ncbi:MAG: hypothetical protein Q9167_003140 [Letrouitia subvulpina]